MEALLGGSDAAEFEVVYGPGSSGLAAALRLVLAAASLSFDDTQLATPEEEADFVTSLRHGKSLPVLFDNVRAVELSQPLAAIRHVARLGGLLGDSPSDALRADVVTELVLGWLPSPGVDAAARMRTLEGVLTRFTAVSPALPEPAELAETAGSAAAGGGGGGAAPAPRPARPSSGPSITCGELLAWLYLDAAAATPEGASALAERPLLARLHSALGGREDVRRFLALRDGPAAAAAGRAAASPADEGGAAAGGGEPVTAAAPSASPSAAPRGKGPVCVTGAAGFLASWIVKILLELGYTVHGTVRSLTDPAAKRGWAHLYDLPFAAERLRLFEGDLLVPGSYSKAMEGCSGLFHCASPFVFTVEDPERDLIKPAVEGTRNALATALATPSISRVVLTSSMICMYATRLPADHFYEEGDWSDEGLLRETGQHYGLSKLLAEREAWRIIKDAAAGRDPFPPAGAAEGAAAAPPGAPYSRPGGAAPLEMAAMCPTLCLGPLLQPRMNQSSAALLELLDGSKAAIPAKQKCIVDVRDVALAHVSAMERPAALVAGRRFPIITGSFPWRAIADVLRKAVPGAPVPTAVEAGPAPHPQALVTHWPQWQLGVKARPMEVTVAEAAMSMEEAGFLDKALAAKEVPAAAPAAGGVSPTVVADPSRDD